MTASGQGQGTTQAGAQPAPRLARHLARCTPCREGLDVMSVQRGVLAKLGRGRAARDGDEAGEHQLVAEVLEACAEDGREKLADLLYEMAHACVRLIPEELAPGEVTKNPDPVKTLPMEVLSGIASEVVGRVPGGCLGDQEIPATSPEPPQAMQAARSCLALLEAIEGRSARRQLTEAFIAQAEADHERVVELLTPMQEEELPEWLWLGVRWLLMAAYLRTGRPQEALAIGSAALQVCPDDRALLFNTATAHAALQDGAAFDRTCESLTHSNPRGQDQAWWDKVLADESAWIAGKLGRDVDVVRAQLQFAPEGGGVGS